MDSLRAFFSLHRRLLAALLIGCAVLGLAHRITTAPQGTQVLVLARDLSAGAVIGSEDVTSRTIPTDLYLKSMAINSSEVLGRRSAVALKSGQILHRDLLLHSKEIPKGRAIVPINIRDSALLDLLEPGRTITLVAFLDHRVEQFRDVRVSALPPKSQSGQGGMVVVEVPSASAGTIAAVGQSGHLSVVIDG